MRFVAINNFSVSLLDEVTPTSTELLVQGDLQPLEEAVQNGIVPLTLFKTSSQGIETDSEIVYAKSAGGGIVSVSRAQEGTTALAFAAGDNLLTAEVSGEDKTRVVRCIPENLGRADTAQIESDNWTTLSGSVLCLLRGYAVQNITEE